MKFNEKLKNFRLENEKTQKQMAEIMAITERGYRHYELNKRVCDADKLQKLKVHFKNKLDLNDLLDCDL